MGQTLDGDRGSMKPSARCPSPLRSVLGAVSRCGSLNVPQGHKEPHHLVPIQFRLVGTTHRDTKIFRLLSRQRCQMYADLFQVQVGK